MMDDESTHNCLVQFSLIRATGHDAIVLRARRSARNYLLTESFSELIFLAVEYMISNKTKRYKESVCCLEFVLKNNVVVFN